MRLGHVLWGYGAGMGVCPGFVSWEIGKTVVEHAMVKFMLLADERWAILVPASMSFLQAWGTVAESGRQACTCPVVFPTCTACVSGLLAYGRDVSPELTLHAAGRLPFVLDHVDSLATDR